MPIQQFMPLPSVLANALDSESQMNSLSSMSSVLPDYISCLLEKTLHKSNNNNNKEWQCCYFFHYY